MAGCDKGSDMISRNRNFEASNVLKLEESSQKRGYWLAQTTIQPWIQKKKV